MASATGLLVWVGCSPLGSGDGRIAVYRRDQVGRLLDPPGDDQAPGEIHRTILDHLAQHGASFLMELEDVVRDAQPAADGEAFTGALWDLVWAGRITNDTYAPLRALGRRKSSRSRGRVVAGGRWSLVSGLTAAEVLTPSGHWPEPTCCWSATAS